MGWFGVAKDIDRRTVKANFGAERANLGAVKANFGAVKANFGAERANFGAVKVRVALFALKRRFYSGGALRVNLCGEIGL